MVKKRRLSIEYSAKQEVSGVALPQSKKPHGATRTITHQDHEDERINNITLFSELRVRRVRL
jgi:hypothetical protein